jgi:hypothetical protein
MADKEIGFQMVLVKESWLDINSMTVGCILYDLFEELKKLNL